MDDGAFSAAVAEFEAARARGEYFPAAWFDRLSLDDAYRLQLALIDRRGDKRDRLEGRAHLARDPAAIPGA